MAIRDIILSKIFKVQDLTKVTVIYESRKSKATLRYVNSYFTLKMCNKLQNVLIYWSIASK